MNHFFAECRFAACSQTQDRIVWDGAQTLYTGERGRKLYRESFAPNCWLRDPDNPPTVQLSHDGETVGQVGVVIAHNEWHIATLILEDLPIVRERFKVGAKVSVGCHSLKRHEDSDLRLVRHTVARLDHIALVNPGEIQGHIGATITNVRDAPKPTRREPADQPAIHDGELLVRDFGSIIRVR
jgi:hypothetical protein